MGGKTDKPPPSITLEKIKSDFRLTGDIFNKDEYLQGIDLGRVYAYFNANPPQEGRNMYRAFEDYKHAQSM